ncbi:MAG: ATP-binding protein, partial [Verrucomicrobiales bacterium]
GLYALYDPEEPKRFKQTITAAISKHRNWEAHTEFRRKDGSGGMCEVRYTPLLDESGRPLALVGVSRIAEPMVASAPAPVTTSSEPVDSLDGLRRSLGSFADIVAVQEAAADLSEGARGELASNRARLEAVSILLQTIEDGGDLEQVDFGQYVRKLIQFLLAEFGPEHTGIEVHLNVKGIMIPVAVAQPLAIILFELMSNSLRHAFARRDQGMVGVSMGVGPDSGWLVVNDDGRGLPSGFDFDSPEHGAGLRIAASQAKRIGGEMTLVNPVDTEIQVGFRLNGAT